jgi:hypothetical protein
MDSLNADATVPALAALQVPTPADQHSVLTAAEVGASPIIAVLR